MPVQSSGYASSQKNGPLRRADFLQQLPKKQEVKFYLYFDGIRLLDPFRFLGDIRSGGFGIYVSFCMADMRPPPSGSNCTLQPPDFGCFTVGVYRVFNSMFFGERPIFLRPNLPIGLGWPQGYGYGGKPPNMAICIGKMMIK